MRSYEYFRLSDDAEEIRVQTDIVTVDGTKLSLVRYLVRCVDATAPLSVPFKLAAKSEGWLNADLRSRRIFDDVTVKILEPLELTTPSDGVPLAPSTRTSAHVVTKRYGDVVSNGEKITAYEVLVRSLLLVVEVRMCILRCDPPD